MNKKNQGTEVKLSVIAMSAILVASLFVMGSSRFIPDAMAQNFTNQTGAAAGGAANQTGAAAGGAANQTGAAANQTGAAAGGAAGGAANQSAMVMIPQAAMTSMMADIDTVRGAIDEGDTEAVDALDNVEMQLRTAAGLPPAEPEVTDEEEDTGPADEEEDTGPADEEEGGPADEEEGGPADEDEEEGGTTTPG
jgi:hypothetical protein